MQPRPTDADPASAPAPIEAVVLKGTQNHPRTTARRTHHVRELIETLVLLAVIFLIMHAALQFYRVDGVSMQPGLRASEYVVVSPFLYAFGGAPQRGDVIAFYSPLDRSQQLLKRVIGVPGDTVSITPDGITINGKRLSEPYVQLIGNSALAECGGNFPNIKVGADQYLVLGDNRNNSLDSRCFGSVPRRNIVGKAIAVVLPLNAIHWLNTYSSVFAGLH